jgi:ABC-2 type transport system ATP-binding protein
MSAAGVVMEDLGMARPSLDDVFLTLTGHSADPDADPNRTAEHV